VADDIEAAGWPVTALHERPGLRLSLVFRLARFFHRHQAQIIHTHNSKPLSYAAPAARLAGGSRVVHTRHGQRFQARRRETMLFRWATRLTQQVVCVSHDSARLSEQEGIAPRRIRTVWNGIDVSRFAFRGPQAGGPVVMVGRLSPEKDVATLLRAAALAARAEPAFRLEIAGDGACLPALRQLARGLGLEDQVRFLGEVRDVPALLARAAAFVLPSLTEGISLTILEAMARGLPVAATRVGGNPEVILDGETGLLVPSQDPAALADALLRLFRDPALGRRLGEAARQRVETHFDVRRMVADYEQLYLGLVGCTLPRDAATVGPAPLLASASNS
jgi:glycosyltransferase involved in cell wall biosynthesis